MKIHALGAIMLFVLAPMAPAMAQDAPGPAVASDPIAVPAPGKAQIIFFRSGTLIGGAISCAVHEGGARLTRLPPGHFSALDVDPGAHDFTVASEAADTLHVDAQAGRTYYGLCTVGVGVMAGHPHLRASDAATFSGMVGRLKPVKAAG